MNTFSFQRKPNCPDLDFGRIPYSDSGHKSQHDKTREYLFFSSKRTHPNTKELKQTDDVKEADLMADVLGKSNKLRDKEEVFCFFVDFKKTFDTVPRDKFWRRMEDLESPLHYRKKPINSKFMRAKRNSQLRCIPTLKHWNAPQRINQHNFTRESLYYPTYVGN